MIEHHQHSILHQDCFFFYKNNSANHNWIFNWNLKLLEKRSTILNIELNTRLNYQSFDPTPPAFNFASTPINNLQTPTRNNWKFVPNGILYLLAYTVVSPTDIQHYRILKLAWSQYNLIRGVFIASGEAQACILWH